MKRSRALSIALFVAAWLGTARAWGQSNSTAVLTSPLTVASVVAFARGHRAEIIASRARAQAAGARPAIVSSLSDPMLMLSVDHLPFMLNGVNASAMYQQDFPLSGVLRDRRQAAESAARRAAIEVHQTELDIELEAAQAYWMLVERRRVEAVVTEQLQLATQLVSASTARYAAAQGTQADVLRAQTEVAQLTAELEATRAEIDGALAMLNAALARPPESPVPPTEPTSTFQEPPALAAVLLAAAGRRPEIAAMRAELTRARAEVHVMQSMYWPMAFIRAGVSTTMADGPGVMAMFGISIPLWRGRLRAGVVEAEQMAAMANADIAAMQRMVEGEVSRMRADVVAARARALALRDQVLPLAGQGFTAALSTYVSGQSQLVSVVEARRMLADVRMSLVMSTIAFELSWARLDRAMGGAGSAGSRR